jgi:hypothetical protein
VSSGGRTRVLVLLGLSALLAACGDPLPRAVAPAVPADFGARPDSVNASTHGYQLAVRVAPNSWQRWNDVDLRLSRGGAAVRRVAANVRFVMPAMTMGAPRFHLREVRPGLYRYTGPAISMPGLWVLTFDLSPPSGPAFTFTVRDHVRG